jgi:hypothetical protein
MKKMCQSCAMPLELKGSDVRATEADNSKSEEYCYYCYANGVFIEPNATYEQILERGIKGIKNGQGTKFIKWIMIKSYPKMLKNTKRFKSK